MSQPVVHITNLSLYYRQIPVLRDLDWTIAKGDHWLLCGESGSGKTSLAKAISAEVKSIGSIAVSTDVHYVANWYQFKDLEGQSNFYYQQRYNKHAVEVTATVAAELKAFGAKHRLDLKAVEPLITAFGYEDLMASAMIQLSSGEHKKLQLIKALWLKPGLLILDQPYNGLDTNSRKNLNTLLDQLADEGVQLILISNDPEIPHCINRFTRIESGKLVELDAQPAADVYSYEQYNGVPAFLAEEPVKRSSDSVIRMIDVNISYGEKHVLKNINWEVNAGEKWLLQGHNGSGKSTLLSLISGDHPQAYSNNFYLFGNKRGTGESIWEIKEKIGLISPELHWYFDPSATVWQSVASGFYDSSGLFCEPGSTRHGQVDELIGYFGLSAVKNVLMNELPLGKQRLAMLARTIIKNPEVLILDEPCQGLDQQQTKHFNKLVDELCKKGTTLIYVGHFSSQIPDYIEKRILLENGSVKSVETILESV